MLYDVKTLFFYNAAVEYTNCYHQWMRHGNVSSCICASVCHYQQCSRRLEH